MDGIATSAEKDLHGIVGWISNVVGLGWVGKNYEEKVKIANQRREEHKIL